MSADSWQPTSIDGLWACTVTVGVDARGSGRRATDVAGLKKAGVEFSPTDAFVVTTRPGVLRGMHTQRTGAKVISCLFGSVHEVVLDVRPGSSTFGRVEAFDLSAESRLSLCIPAGVAHGFVTLGETDSVVLIQSDLSQGADGASGVRWDSFGHTWPVSTPVLSDRDAALPNFCPKNNL